MLHPVTGITQKLQGRTIDVIDEYQNVHTCIEDIQLLREDVDQECDVIFKEAVRMADQLNVEPNIPKDNVPNVQCANSPEEYYKRALVIQIVDTFISEMTHRFNKFSCKAAKLLILTQSVLCSEKFKESVGTSPILEEYEQDLISRDVVDQDLLLWQRKWLTVASKDRPDRLAKAIRKFIEESFLNVFALLKIACTFPITPAECEHSFFAMRRLSYWLRASMKMERLGSVAIMDIHRQEEVDYKHVSELFFQLHPRKINLTNLLFDCNFIKLCK